MGKTAKKAIKKKAGKSSPTSSSQPSPKSTPATPATTPTVNDATNKEQSSNDTEPAPLPKQYTPAQIEQAQLSRELDQYVTEFQQKQFRLAFQPSEQELIILFIMNLHPRFRRFVEPDFLSFSNWIEAAAFARLHCTRISAIMGAERIDENPMFQSAESRALIESGYFVSSKSPSASMYPRAEAIQHLLIPTVNGGGNNQVKNSISPSSSSSSTPVLRSGLMSIVDEEQEQEQQPTIKGKEEDRKMLEKAALTGQNSWLSVLDNNADKFMAVLPRVDVEQDDKENTATAPTQEPSTSSSSTAAAAAAEKPPATTDAKCNNNSKQQATTGTTGGGDSPLTKSAVQARINQAVKAKKEKEKAVAAAATTASKENDQFLYQVKSNPNNPNSICYRLPEEHVGINLAFLELTINSKHVRGLLAKVRWGSSAMSLDCVKRLGLTMKETNNFCIHTDFGYEDTIGILKLPIVHPADPNVKSEMEIQVLPLIYGGKVDLVLGADFFYFFQPTLNIKTRAIRFLDREAPYIVSKIE